MSICVFERNGLYEHDFFWRSEPMKKYFKGVIVSLLISFILIQGAHLMAYRTYDAKEQKIYRQRREKLMENLPDTILFIMNHSEPNLGQFITEPNFLYLTGLDNPNSALLLWKNAPREEWREILFLPPKDPQKEIWTGAKLSPGDEAKKLTGIETTLPVTQLEEMLGRLLRMNPKLGVIHEEIGIRSPLTPYLQLVQDIHKRFPALTLVNLSTHLDDLRRVKDPYEIKKIQKAIDITGKALITAMKTLRPGMREFEVQAYIEFEMKRLGALQFAFPSIIASGKNATILHYDENTGLIQEGDLVLMDVGARYDYYCADITRTVPASGKFTEEQRKYYELVLEAQKRALETIRPGVRIRDVIHKAVTAFFEEKEVRKYFPHGTSHYLGLIVHDVGDVTKPLEPGVIITVEPGLYIPEKNIGIRIEDDVLVTENGYKVLSKDIPKQIEDIEAIMRSKP